MQKSHVLICCELGTEEIVRSEIKKIKDVKNIERTLGYYDLIIEIESEHEEKLKKIIGNTIKNIDGKVCLNLVTC